MSKVTKSQAESLRAIASAAVGSFVEMGATKDEELKLRKQIDMLFKLGMTPGDLDYAMRTLARDKDESFLVQLRYARKVLQDLIRAH